MTDAELRALVAKATPGPWTCFYKSKYDEWHVGVPMAGSSMKWGIFDDGIRTDNPEADARLIVAAVNALPALLDRLEAAERDAELLRGALHTVMDFAGRLRTMSDDELEAWRQVAADAAREEK